MLERRKSREIKIGGISIGGGNKIAVQSMLNVKSEDAEACAAQITLLKSAGCDIVRMAVTGREAVNTIGYIKNRSVTDKSVDIPIVADIHFNYKLAIDAAYAGADKIRINPGNIGDEGRIKLVANICLDRRIPIRIGVNGGSLEEDILKKHGSPTAEAMAESAVYHIRLLEKFDFNDIVVSIKSSSVDKMIEANDIIADMFDYPIHIGVTEAGTAHMGLIKNAAGIGALLCRGIGDTIRVSLTAPPVLEVYEGNALLKALGLSESGINIISCPTCGRCKTDLITIANETERRLAEVEKRLNGRKLNVAVMGCAVNGPGEAKEADIGIAGGIDKFLLFKHGEIIKKVDAESAVDELISAVEEML